MMNALLTWWTWPAVSMGAGIFVGIAVVTIVGILVLEAQRRRDEQASTFQSDLAEPISRELGLAGVSVLPTVKIPVWRAATHPAVITLTGRVPSRDIRDRVIRLVEYEAARLRYFRIEDRIGIQRIGDDARRRHA